MPNMWMLIVQVVVLFLQNLKKNENCPDGVCDEGLALGESLRSQLKSENVGFGLFDMVRFLRCFPMDRVFGVVKRVVALLQGCNHCPDGDCTFWDLLGCLDLKEAAAIAQEILAIIRDSRICEDGRGEITLGQATE